MQQKLRAHEIIPNENICFPIRTILAVEQLYGVLNFSTVFGKHKKNGIDINDLLKALVSYKLTDNFSISKAHEWINRDEVLDIFNLEEFSERTLYRFLSL
jgi:transposase